MTVEAKNPARNQHGGIDIELNHPVHGWIPFTASPDDVEAHGRAIYEMAERGDFGEVAPYVEPEE